MNQQAFVIELHNLEFRWRASKPLVLNIEQLSVAQGERLFIKGASGSGKSTLLSLLGGVLSPQRGEIKVLDQWLQKMGGARRDTFRADHIGFIFQMFNLIPYLTILENVILPLHFSQRRRRRVEQQGGLQQEAERLLAHLGLQGAMLHQAVTELSVGQQQRVAAARALIGGPEIIIADEPTSSLDADSREAFIHLLINECHAADSTLVFVSHDSSLETFFDRRLSLADVNKAEQAVM